MRNLRQGTGRALLGAAVLCFVTSGPAMAADRTAALDELIKASKAEGATLIAHAIVDDVREERKSWPRWRRCTASR